MKIHTFVLLLSIFTGACTPWQDPDSQQFKWPGNFHVEVDGPTETLLYMQAFTASDGHNRGFNMVLETWDDASGKNLLQSRLRAGVAEWDSAAALWRLHDVYLVENYDLDDQRQRSFEQLDTVLGFSPYDIKVEIDEWRRAR